MVDNNQEYLEISLKLVKQGGKILLDNYKKKHKITYKSDRSFVSNVDKHIENLYFQEIKKVYPKHSIHGEETGNYNQSSLYRWIIDPLDGTSNFLFGIPLFGTMIALTYKSQVILSVINLPVLNLVFHATYGKGAKINGVKIFPPLNNTTQKTTIFADSGKSIKNRTQLTSILKDLLPNYRSLRVPGAVCSHLIPLSSFDPAISIILNAPIHDIAPIYLIFKEIGYNCLNLHKKPWQPSDKSLISSLPNQACNLNLEVTK